MDIKYNRRRHKFEVSRLDIRLKALRVLKRCLFISQRNVEKPRMFKVDEKLIEYRVSHEDVMRAIFDERYGANYTCEIEPIFISKKILAVASEISRLVFPREYSKVEIGYSRGDLLTFLVPVVNLRIGTEVISEGYDLSFSISTLMYDDMRISNYYVKKLNIVEDLSRDALRNNYSVVPGLAEIGNVAYLYKINSSKSPMLEIILKTIIIVNIVIITAKIMSK